MMLYKVLLAALLGAVAATGNPSNGGYEGTSDWLSEGNVTPNHFVHGATSSASSPISRQLKQSKKKKSPKAKSTKSPKKTKKPKAKKTKAPTKPPTPSPTKAPKSPKSPKKMKSPKKAPKKTSAPTPSPTTLSPTTAPQSIGLVDITVTYSVPIPSEAEVAAAVKSSLEKALRGDLTRRRLQEDEVIVTTDAKLRPGGLGTFDTESKVEGPSKDVDEAVANLDATEKDALQDSVAEETEVQTGNPVVVEALSDVQVDVIVLSNSPSSSPSIPDDDAISNSTSPRRLDDFETDCTCDDNDIISCTAPFAELECSCEDGDIICEDSSLVW